MVEAFVRQPFFSRGDHVGRPLWNMYDFPTRLLEKFSNFLTGRPRGDPYKLHTTF